MCSIYNRSCNLSCLHVSVFLLITQRMEVARDYGSTKEGWQDWSRQFLSLTLYLVQSLGINCFSENDAIHLSSLSKRQLGFQKNRSCLTQLLLTFSEINKALKNNSTCDVTYLDFKRSFGFGAPWWTSLGEYRSKPLKSCDTFEIITLLLPWWKKF